MNNGMKARTRVRSIAATLELVSMTTKYVTEAATITPVVTWDRFDSLTNPVANDPTITTTATTITPIAQPIALRGNGFGAVRPWAPRLRRNATYCTIHTAMPIAAAPKP